MKVYAVFQQAVYRHACGGIFESRDGAVEAANRLADADKDDHHTYEVVPFELGQPCPTSDDKWAGMDPDDYWFFSINEEDPVYEVKKK